MLSTNIYVAKTAAVSMWQGRRVRVLRDKTTAEEGNAFFEAHRNLFKPLVINFPAPADAAPAGPEAETTTTPASPEAEPGDAPPAGEAAALDAEKPKRPPLFGKGSSLEAWRAYAAAVSDSPAEAWSALSRDEIIALLKSEGVDES